MSLSTFMIFLLTTAIVVLSPGATAIAIASQGVANGSRRAFAGVVGIASANAVYFMLSATGTASLLIASAVLFSVIKWVGVAYLVWLGLNAIFSRAGAIRVQDAERKPSALYRLFAHGFIVEAANPK